MKKAIVIAVVAALSVVGCKQETHSETVATPTTTVETSTTEPVVDTAATAAVTDAARDAAHATGTAMETAGEAIQRETTDTTDTAPATRTDTNP